VLAWQLKESETLDREMGQTSVSICTTLCKQVAECSERVVCPIILAAACSLQVLQSMAAGPDWTLHLACCNRLSMSALANAGDCAYHIM